MGDGRDGRGVTGDLCFLDGIGVEILNIVVLRVTLQVVCLGISEKI